MLAVQTFSVTCLFFWGLLATYPIIWFVNKLIPIRLSPEDEIKGCDIVEHYIGDEKDLLQPYELQFVSPHINLSLPTNTRNIAPYKEFNILNKRKSFNVNLGNVREDIEQQNSSARL